MDMAVQEEYYLLSTEEDCSSLEEDTDSELDLGEYSSVSGSESTISSIQQPYNNENYVPIVRTQYVVNHDIVDEGLRLYLMFLQEEIVRNSLQAPEYLRPNRIPRNLSTLRALADRFSTSTQREWIRQQAEVIPLQSLNFHTFTDLLVALFQEGGVTWERILALFYFCTDISIRALQEQLVLQFRRIQNWVTRFLEETVCRWVEMEGGWGVILQQSLKQATKLAIFGFCCVGIIALCIYIRNNTK